MTRHVEEHAVLHMSHPLGATMFIVPVSFWGNEPNIIKPHLKLWLDAGMRKSYTDASTSWYNYVNTSQTATLVNTPGFSYNNGGYISFNGTDECAYMNDLSGVNSFTSSDNYSIESWTWISSIQNNTSVVDNVILEKWNSSNQSSYPYVMRWVRGSSSTRFAAYNGVTNPICDFSVSTDQCTHLVGTFDHTNNLLVGYRNGVEANSVTMDLSGVANTNVFGIGRRAGLNNTSGIGYFTGRFAEIRIYDKALSSQEVNTNYQATRSRFGV